MSDMDEFIIPPGYSPPFAVVTKDDHRAWILVAASLGLACTLLFGGIRIFVRQTICPGLGLDDLCAGIATLLAVIQSFMIMGATADGLGKSVEIISAADAEKAQRVYYAGTLLFVLAVGLSKLSVACFLLRLTSFNTHKRVFRAVAGLVCLWIVGSMLALALQCDLSRPWIVLDAQCKGNYSRWLVIGVLDIVTEVLLVAMSGMLVWALQTSWQKRLAVVQTFAPRLFVIIPIAYHLRSFDEYGRNSNVTLADSLFIVWTQTQMSYAIIAATMPVLRPFTNNLNTQFGGLGESEAAYGYNSQGSKSRSKSKSYELSQFRSREASRSDAKSGNNALEAPTFAPSSEYAYQVRVSRRHSEITTEGAGSESMQRDTTSVTSKESERLIITKAVAYTVEEADARV